MPLKKIGRESLKVKSVIQKRRKFRKLLLDRLEDRRMMAGDLAEGPFYPAISEDVLWDSPDVFHLSASWVDESYQGHVSKESWKDVNGALATASDALMEGVTYVAGKLFSPTEKNNPLGNPDEPMNLKTSQPGQTLFGGNKDDQQQLNHNRSVGIGGEGDDQIKADANYITIFGNQGSDYIESNGVGNKLNAGSGDDIYVIGDRAVDNEIMDPSKFNTVELRGLNSQDASITWEGKDARIQGKNGQSVKIRNFNTDKQDYSVKFSNGSLLLSNAVSVKAIDKVNLAIAAYKKSDPIYQGELAKSGIVEIETIKGPVSGLSATLYKRSVPGSFGKSHSLKGQYAVGIAGTEDLRDFGVFGLIPGAQILPLQAKLREFILENHVTSLTISGHSGGGEIAYVLAGALAVEFPGVQFDVTSINSGGVFHPHLAWINQLPNLKIMNYVYEGDILSKLDALRGLGRAGEVVIIPFDSSSGPSAKDNPWEWIVYHHAAERVLDYFKRNPGSKGGSTGFQSPLGFKDLPEAIKKQIQLFTQGLSEASAPPSISEYTARFDFGIGKYTQSNYVSVGAETYSQSRGYGWKQDSNIEINDSAQGNDLNRDFAIGKSLPFQIDLPAGYYDVTVVAGSETAREYVAFFANSERLGEFNSGSDEIRKVTYRVAHGGGTLELELRDTGGADRKAVWNGLEIDRVAPWKPEVDNQTDSDPALTLILPGYSEPVTWMDKLEKSIEPLKKIANSIVAVATGPGGAVITVKQLYEIFRSAKELANTWSSSEPEVPNWALKMQIEINEQNLKKGLPLQRLSRKIMLLTDVEGMSNDALQKLVHKRSFVILDAQKQLNDGVEPYGWFKDGVKDLEAHRQSMQRVRDQSTRIIANKIRAHKEDTKKPFNKLDVLVAGEDFGAQAGKEGIDYLIQKHPQLLDSLGYVELLALNHVAVTSAGPSPNLYHNDTRPFAYFVTQYYENETDVPNGFKKGPLDGKESGSYAAIDNGLVRNFSSADPVGAKRFRNFSSEGMFVSENVQFVGKRDDGLLIMINETGNLSIMDSVKQTRVIDTKVFASGFTIGKLAPDGSKLAMLGDGGTLVVMDIATKQVSNRIKLGQGCVDLVWSSDGNAIVVGRQSGALENVVIRNNVLLSPVLLANTTKGLLRFWIQEKQVITYHNDGSLQLWGLNNKTTPILILRSNLGSKVTAIDFSKNGELVVARGAVVDVYQLKDASWNLKITLSDNRNDIKAIAFSADGTTLALGGEDCQLRTYSLPALREGTRLVMATYNPPMLPIKQIALSGNGQELSVSYRMHVGGRVIDRDISEDIARDVKILDHLRDDERKIAKRLPEVVVDKYMNQLRFFERKDRTDLEQQYGYSSKMANWKMAQYSQATDDLLRFQADGEEGTGATDGSLQPEIQKRIGFQKINDGFTLSLSSYVSHLNAEGVQINVSSMDPGVVEITRQENVVTLSPVSEGRTMVNVTIDFPGGSYDLSFITEVSAEAHRAKIEALKQELARLKRETSAADQASDAVQKMVNRREDNIDAFAKEADAYAKRVAKAEAELKKEIDAQGKFLAQRDNISKSTKESRELLEKNLSTSETLSKQLDQAEADVRSQNGRVKDLRGAVNAARDRLDRATKAQRDARRRELDAAVANLSSAENQLSSLQAVKRDIDKRLGDCLDTVASLRKRISNLSEDLKDVERRVEQSAKEINKLSKNLAEIRAPKALVDQKKRLEDNIATDIKSVSEMFSNINERSSRMQTVLNEFKRIESMKWIKGLGLERLMREEVNPVLKQMESYESQVTSMQKQLQRQQKLVQGFDLN